MIRLGQLIPPFFFIMLEGRQKIVLSFQSFPLSQFSFTLWIRTWTNLASFTNCLICVYLNDEKMLVSLQHVVLADC